MITLKKIIALCIAFVVVTFGLMATYFYIRLNDYGDLWYWLFFISSVAIVGVPTWEHWYLKIKKWFKL